MGWDSSSASLSGEKWCHRKAVFRLRPPVDFDEKVKLMKKRTPKYKEKGQATLEFLVIVPVFIGLFLLAVAIAVVWSGHQLSSAVSLEAASREAAKEGAGVNFVFTEGNSAMQSVNWAVEIEDYNFRGYKGKRFTVRGNVNVPWAPFGLNWSIPVQGTTFYPVFEFNGD